MDSKLYIIRYFHIDTFEGNENTEDYETGSLEEAKEIFDGIFEGSYAKLDREFYSKVQLIEYSFDTHSETMLSEKI